MREAAACFSAALALGSAPAAAEPARELVFTGACDISAAVPLGEGFFAAADDEDSILRIYDARRGGAPLHAVDLAPSLGLVALPKPAADSEATVAPGAEPAPGAETATTAKQGKHGKKHKKGDAPRRAPETDLEAAARLGDLAFWMTSHGRNRSGERKDARLRFFATSAPERGDGLQLVGTPYEGLLEDLLADPRLARFGLAAAAELAPKEPGGLNLEGLVARPEGGLWIGFRNPIPGGRALLVPLLNPERVIEGARARFGDPLRLDLGGLGVRALGWWRGRGLILAGPHADGDASRLYAWDGRAAAVPISGVDLGDLNPEAFFTPSVGERVLVLSDDGTRRIDGKQCKRLRDPARKRFRGAWLALPALAKP
jgi:hypothetical protein